MLSVLRPMEDIANAFSHFPDSGWMQQEYGYVGLVDFELTTAFWVETGVSGGVMLFPCDQMESVD